MKRTPLAAIAILAVATLITPACAQSLSDLLQKAIYTQETVGDLDGAIQLYRQIVIASKDTRPYGAQAQYRLGLCLLKKGNQTEAVNAFKSLVEHYPEQTDLVAKAREHLAGGMDLLPAPWTDGEILDFRMKVGSMVGATQVFSVDRGAADTWLLKTCMYLGVGTMNSRLEVRRDNMRPVESWYRNYLMGTAHAVYQGNLVRVELAGKPATTVNLEGPVYDNDSFYHLIRRLPLAPGYKTTIGVISPLGAVPVNITVQVIGLEDVQTPVGKFQAYKVEMSAMRQTFWVANEPRRLLVKYEAATMTAELSGIRQRDRLTPSNYANPAGYSVELPAGWLTQPMPTPAKDMVMLLDPEATANVLIWSGAKAAEPAAFESSLRKEADQVIENRVKSLPDFKVRPSSWQTRQINGRPALSLIADYTPMNKATAEYMTWVRNESLITQFRVMCDPGDFEVMRRRMDPIIDTIRLK